MPATLKPPQAFRQLNIQNLEVDTDATEEGFFEGYATVWGNINFYEERILKGSFIDSIRDQQGKFPVLDNHDSDKEIGHTTQVFETEYGLKVKGKLYLDSSKNAREVWGKIKERKTLGNPQGMSIGFWIKESQYDDEGIREVTRADLWEVSMVTFPANPLARVLSRQGGMRKLAVPGDLEQPQTYSSVFLQLGERAAEQVIKLLDELPEEVVFLREEQPHITVLYGIHSDNAEDIAPLLEQTAPFKLHIGGYGVFEHPDYDVLYLRVQDESGVLSELNATLANNLAHTTFYDGYHPHVTLAYLAKGKGSMYAESLPRMSMHNLEFDKVMFSTPNDAVSELILIEQPTETVTVTPVASEPVETVPETDETNQLEAKISMLEQRMTEILTMPPQVRAGKTISKQTQEMLSSALKELTEARACEKRAMDILGELLGMDENAADEDAEEMAMDDESESAADEQDYGNDKEDRSADPLDDILANLQREGVADYLKTN